MCCTQACDVAIEDTSERVMNMMVQLLKDFTSSFVVTPDQFDKVSTCLLFPSVWIDDFSDSSFCESCRSCKFQPCDYVIIRFMEWIQSAYKFC